MRSVTMYKTSDGVIHTTEQRAKRHEDDLLLRKLDQLVNHIFPDAHQPSVIKGLQRLVDSNRGGTELLLKDILHTMQYYNDE